MSLLPPILEKGQWIGIIAPAGHVDPVALKMGIEVIQQWGLNVRVSPNALKNPNYFSASDKQRAEDLQQYIDDPEIKTIICARGGYGVSRIIDFVNFERLREQPKWMVGFSDITLLHLKLNRLGIASLHGMMPTQYFLEGAYDSAMSVKNFLFGQSMTLTIPPHAYNQTGTVEAEIIGGNLSLITHSIGTPEEIDCRDKILFIEEIDEYIYKIDRMIIQLDRSGKLAQMAGLIVGHMSGIKDTTTTFGEGAYEVIRRCVQKYDIPVAFGFPMGHELENIALPLGHRVTLDVTHLESILTIPSARQESV